MMASPDFSDVWEALIVQTRTVAGLRFIGDRVPDSIGTCPAAIVQPSPGEFLQYDAAMGDIGDYMFLVTLYGDGADAIAGQKQLDPFLRGSGPTSVRSALNGNLAGLVSAVRVRIGRNYRAEIIDSARYIACDLVVTVQA